MVENYEYSGEKYLTQYEVVDMVMMSTNNSKNVQEIFVEILLGRELLEVILNIISPTMALNLISYTTNFYREEYFETVVAINLTTMLVIVTLFVSVSSLRFFFPILFSIIIVEWKSPSNFIHQNDWYLASLQSCCSLYSDHPTHIHGLSQKVSFN